MDAQTQSSPPAAYEWRLLAPGKPLAEEGVQKQVLRWHQAKAEDQRIAAAIQTWHKRMGDAVAGIIDTTAETCLRPWEQLTVDILLLEKLAGGKNRRLRHCFNTAYRRAASLLSMPPPENDRDS